MNAMHDRYLPPEDQAVLHGLHLAMRGAAGGTWSGAHRSARRGGDVEFEDYRGVSPGEDLSQVDWRVYGRSDRLYVRRSRVQTVGQLQVLIDASASMGFRGSATPWQRRPAIEEHGDVDDSKYDHACRLAAGLGFVAQRQGDRVGLCIAQRGRVDMSEAQATSGHLRVLLQDMATRIPAGRAPLAAGLAALGRRPDRGGRIAVISDLLAGGEDLPAALRGLVRTGRAVTLLHVLQDEELRPSDLSQSILLDSETNDAIALADRHWARRYPQRLRRWLEQWRQTAARLGVVYVLADMRRPATDTVAQCLRRTQPTWIQRWRP